MHMIANPPWAAWIKGLTEAVEKHWIVVDMKADWKIVFPATSAP